MLKNCQDIKAQDFSYIKELEEFKGLLLIVNSLLFIIISYCRRILIITLITIRL